MARTATRLLAFYMVFQADFGQEPDYALAIEEFPRPVNEDFLRQLVDGVLSHGLYLDEVISQYSRGWSVERMPKVDRAILRLATWELLGTDIPLAAAINEAVKLAKDFGGAESPAFVNGVLDSIKEHREDLLPGLEKT
jgi:N utilization substance protein B